MRSIQQALAAQYYQAASVHASQHPLALTQQLMSPAPAVVPPVQTPPQPTAALARSYVNHAVNTASWRTGDRHNTPHVVISKKQPSSALKTQSEMGTSDTPSFPPFVSTNLFFITEDDVRGAPSWNPYQGNTYEGYEGIVSAAYLDNLQRKLQTKIWHMYDDINGHYLKLKPLYVQDISSLIQTNNYNYMQQKAAYEHEQLQQIEQRKHEEELQRRMRESQSARHKNNLDNDYKNNVNSSKAIQRSILKKIFSSSPIADLTFDPYTAILTHRTSKYAI